MDRTVSKFPPLILDSTQPDTCTKVSFEHADKRIFSFVISTVKSNQMKGFCVWKSTDMIKFPTIIRVIDIADGYNVNFSACYIPRPTYLLQLYNIYWVYNNYTRQRRTGTLKSQVAKYIWASLHLLQKKNCSISIKLYKKILI